MGQIINVRHRYFTYIYKCSSKLTLCKTLLHRTRSFAVLEQDKLLLWVLILPFFFFSFFSFFFNLKGKLNKKTYNLYDILY